MKLSILASLFLAGTALAAGSAGGDDKKPEIANGQPCKKDGSMGICQSNLCIQEPDQETGTCRAAGGK